MVADRNNKRFWFCVEGGFFSGRQGGILHMCFAKVAICMKERWAGVNTCVQLYNVLVCIFEETSKI